MTMTTPVEISIDRLRSLLVNAFEGGSNYWYLIDSYVLPPNTTIEDFKKGGKMQPQDDYYHWSQLIPTTPGGSLLIVDREADISVDGQQKFPLDLAHLESGLLILSKKFPHHFAAIVEENDDSDTGDALLQCALFGDIIYG